MGTKFVVGWHPTSHPYLTVEIYFPNGEGGTHDLPPASSEDLAEGLLNLVLKYEPGEIEWHPDAASSTLKDRIMGLFGARYHKVTGQPWGGVGIGADDIPQEAWVHAHSSICEITGGREWFTNTSTFGGPISAALHVNLG